MDVDLNLDTLKREIQEYLDSAGLAVFRSSPGGLEGLPLVLWDAERYPDYQMFLDVARRCGAMLVIFATREFESSDLDDLLSHIDECGFSREEQRDYESRLREMRIFEGVTCTLELAFDHNSKFYIYELQPDWYEEFLSIEDDVAARLADDEDLDDDDSLGGYFSKN
jgi:hypothetical protein